MSWVKRTSTVHTPARRGTLDSRCAPVDWARVLLLSTLLLQLSWARLIALISGQICHRSDSEVPYASLCGEVPLPSTDFSTSAQR